MRSANQMHDILRPQTFLETERKVKATLESANQWHEILQVANQAHTILERANQIQKNLNLDYDAMKMQGEGVPEIGQPGKCKLS